MVSAAADSIETEAFVDWQFLPQIGDVTQNWDIVQTGNVSIPRVNNHEYASRIDVSYYANTQNMDNARMTLAGYKVTSEDGFYGDVGFYLSFYFASLDESGNSIWSHPDYEPPIHCWVRDANGTLLDHTVETDYFNPSSPYESHSVGITTSFNVRVPEVTPYFSIEFGYEGFYPILVDTTYNGLYDLVVPSSALVAERTSAELKELENITNIIITQNNINSQYYGEVIGKVDALYSEVGNLADLQEQAIQQFDDWNTVSSVPGSVQDKVDKADQVIADINSLVKPDPEQIVPDYLPDPEELHDISDILSPFFQNALIVQLCTMVLGFAFVSYVLFGKKG